MHIFHFALLKCNTYQLVRLHYVLFVDLYHNPLNYILRSFKKYRNALKTLNVIFIGQNM